VLLLRLGDQHLLQHVVGEADDFEDFDVAQGQRGYLAFVYPLLGGLGGLLTQNSEAVLQ
jgi:hypothetical protein